MKISPETIAVLKNFSAINKGIAISPGNTIRTRTPAVYAEAVIAEEFPLEVGIYDLNNFLNVVALFKEPEFDFSEEYLRIAEANGKAETKYAYAGAGVVQLSTKKQKSEPPAETLDFVFPEEQWTTLQKAVSVFQKPEIRITSDGTHVRIGTENHKQQSGNAFSLLVEGEPHGYKCNMVFDMNNLRLLKGSYEVTVTPIYAQFKNASGYELSYLIAPEPTASQFGNA